MAEKKGNSNGAGNDIGAGIDSGNNDGNMSVIDKKNQRTLQEIICDVTEQELAQYPDDTMSAAEIEAMIKKRALKTRKRRLRIISAAAVFMIVAIGVFVSAFDGYPTNVEADKNAPQETITDDGVVIEDGGWGSADSDVIEITKWEEVLLLKSEIEKLVIPRVMPNGYEFKQLLIEEVSHGEHSVTFIFNKGNMEIEINEDIFDNSLNSLEIENVDKKIKCSKGIIYIIKNEEINNAIIQINNNVIVRIWGRLKQDEFKLIVEGLDI